MDEGRRYGLHRWLYGHFGTDGSALYVSVTVLLSVSLSGLVAYLFGRPVTMLSLALTAALLARWPMEESARPRNTVIGHSVALASGLLSLALFGLVGGPGVSGAGFSPAHVGAGVLSTVLTGLLMVVTRAWHPPAGATAGLVGLGLLGTPRDLLALAAGVVVVTVCGWLLNRALGVPVPFWTTER
ncbi:MAG: HPP family protein [Actinomycetota bacterium]